MPTPSGGADRRDAGVLIPLFSIPSAGSWGVGEIPDLVAFARWLREAGLNVLQVLPINEMAPGETSPYSAISAMAIDPLFIGLDHVREHVDLGGEASLGAADLAELALVRQAPAIEYERIRPIKARALRAAYARFRDRERRVDSPRARELARFRDAQAWWLDDYTLFRALHARYGERAWTEWDEPLRERWPDRLAEARVELADEIGYYEYVQWLADGQWKQARRQLAGVQLFGDLPFMVNGDSADVWARQDEFLLDASVGAPPDAFSETGQDWGVPVYRWDVIRARGFSWLADRARRTADLFDGYRIDHLVGFYRTFARPSSGEPPYFTPGEEADQLALGEQVMAVFAGPGVRLVAEDLGIVPDFVRASLAALEIPGYRVLRWEREWQLPGQPFRDPALYAERSLATTGTHDTEPLAVWWESAPAEEREQFLAMPALRALAGESVAQIEESLSPSFRDAILELLFASAASILVLPVQDLFGWRDRINEPATISPRNWRYRLKWPVDRLSLEPDAVERARTIAGWCRTYRRGAAPSLPA